MLQFLEWMCYVNVYIVVSCVWYRYVLSSKLDLSYWTSSWTKYSYRVLSRYPTEQGNCL